MLKPLNDRVAIEVAQEEVATAGSLLLTSAAKEKPQTGFVVAVGEGRVLDNGTRLPVAVKIGDQVLFEKYAGSEVKYETKEYLIIREHDIIAIVD
ncbi:co-chaperone GroES [Vagococcus salmoninarum]|uniref:Co-chaperonin GroES n=1 Tax=Vagococcus salmoninarum TaxID=2739 RepID=A0A429ZLX4_9ENTE|nr:co-chaperone GroES [Vagococcus salmoninarum]MBE9389584.1 co-chaperone GroES [Vagococcus salmoninarum]RST94704.1 co-chaperone GroES [Vagococcus salmoninarum]